MKILVIAPTPFFVSRGTPIRILEEALALERRGHTVTLVSYHIGEEIPSKLDTHIDHRRIRRWLFWYKKLEAGADWQKILLDIMLLRKVFSLARKQRPDIIYGHLHEGTLIGWVVKNILFWRKMVLVSDLHGGLTSEMVSHGYLKGGWLRKIFQYVERWVSGLGDVVVTSSWENTNEIKKLRTKGQITETLLDGANSTHYQGSLDEKSIRQKWGIPDDRPVFVYTGALIPNKGMLPLIEAIQMFCNAFGNKACFILAGFPDEYAVGLVRERSLEESVRIISPLHYFDLPGLLSVCDIGIDPKDSATHQASGKILQYMAARLPVVCFDRENNRRYLGEGGVYCQEGARGLYEGFCYCLKHLEDVCEQGKKNGDRVKQFSWDNGSQKIERLMMEKLPKKLKSNILKG